MDDLILSGVRRQNGPAINNMGGVTAAHAAKQAQDLAYTEGQGKSLALGQARLAEGARQFNANLGLAKKQDELSRGYGNTALGISALGLGVSALGDIQQRKNTQALIDRLKQNGDANSMYYADLIAITSRM